MSPSDAQPPLSRRQARERERAASAGGQPVTPPPTVAAPQPTSVDGARRRPGSHVAPAAPGPAQSAGPVVPSAPTSSAGVPDQPPASATEIVPGSGGLTRRQIRQMRAAEGNATGPVPLHNPAPQSSDRTVQDVLGTVAELQADQGGTTPPTAPAASPDRDGSADQPSTDAPAPASLPDPDAEPSDWREPSTETTHLDHAAVEQATAADGSPDALEPLEAAAANAEEPRRHRSTWAPQAGDVTADDAVTNEDPHGPADQFPDADGPTELPSGVLTDTTAAPDAAASTPGVFPLSLDEDDTNEVPVQRDDRPASADAQASQSAPGVAFVRPPEPKPMTTTFATPVGHWSTQAHDSNDTEVHDEATGMRRVAETGSNAIILPNSALADPTGALNATGEVILTGSIDLPASLSSTGSHRPIDGAEVDRLLEQHDEQPETDASPVRASRAVSSHTSTRQVVLAAAKPKESRVPMILGFTVGGVCVAAATVIVVALVSTNFFGS
jgi:hypothetical protein